MKSLLRRFAANTSGNFAMIFALAAVPLFGLAGFAIDYTRAENERTKLQSAADVGALAAIVEFHQGRNGDQEAIAQKFFAANYNGTYPATLTASLSPGKNEMVIDANVSVPTTLLGVIGKSQFEVGVQSTAAIGRSRLKIALVLDTTGSMRSSNKLNLLKRAASDFVDNIIPLAGPADNLVEFAVVPFTTITKIKKSWVNEWWLDLNGIAAPNFKGCMWDRKASLDTTDVNPLPDDSTTFYQASPTSLRETPNCASMTEIQPLSGTRATIKSKISQLSAGGYTNTTIGMVWGINVLRNTLPYSTIDDDSKKMIIFLTDGQNTDGRIMREGGTSADMDAATLQACNTAKSNDITIYSIRVMDGNAAMLKACASEPSKYYDLSDPNQLNEAFEAISREIWQTAIALKK